MKMEEKFFDFTAEAGLTKHLGERGATEALTELCQIQEGGLVLDVGCGVGQTAVMLVQKYGCRVIARVQPINIKDESRSILQRYGCLDMARTLWRALRLYVRNPNYRAFVKRVRNQGVVPQNLTDYFGYGCMWDGSERKRIDGCRNTM